MKHIFTFLFLLQFSTLFSQVAPTLQERYQLCTVQLDEGNYESSIICFKQLLNDEIINENDSIKLRVYQRLNYAYYLIEDIPNSLFYGNKAIQLAKKVAIGSLLAETYDVMAFNYERNANIQESEKQLLKSLTLRLKHRDTTGLVASYSSLGGLYSRIGQFQKAEEYIQNSLRFSLIVNGKNNRSTLITYHTLGRLYSQIGAHEKAIAAFNESLSISENLYGIDSESTIGSLQNIGISYSFLGNYLKAEEFLLRAMKVYKKYYSEKDSYFLSALYGSLSQLYTNKSEFSKALAYAKDNLRVAITVFGENQQNVALSYQNIGGIYGISGDLSKLQQNYDKAVKITENIYGKNSNALASVYTNLGQVLMETDNYEEANQAFSKALSILNKIETTPVAQGNLLHLKGQSFIYTNQQDSAEVYFNKAFEQVNKILPEDNTLLLSLRNYRSRIFTEKKDYEKARQELLKMEKTLAFELVDTFSIKNKFLVNELIQFLSSKSFYYKSQIEKDHYVDTLSMIYLIQIRAIEDSYVQLSENESRNTYSEIYHHIYERAIAHFYEYDVKKGSAAFQIAERIKKSRRGEEFYKATSNLLSDSLLRLSSHLKESILTLEKKRIKQQEQTGDSSAYILQLLSDSLFDLRRKHDQVLINIKSEIPAYYDLHYTPFDFSVKKCQKSLSENESLLEYFIGDSTLYIFVVNKSDFHFVKVNLKESVTQQVENLRKSIHVYPLVKKEQKSQFTRSAFELYKILIQPVENHLKKEVIVVADDILHLVPFEVLLSWQTPPSSSYSEMPYFIKDKLISYQFSAKEMVQLRKKGKHEFVKKVAAFAPSYQINRAKTLESYTDLKKRFDLRPLKYNVEEAKKIVNIYEGQSFFDSIATKSEFMKASQEFSILHVAAHGKSYRDKGGYSYLAFNSDSSGIDLKNMLFVEDLYNSKFHNDLIVLSACETGIGELQKGTGVVSLSKGFAFAGVRSQLSTLWKVDDKFSGEFMPHFYKNLKNGMRKNEALHEAKLSFIQNEKYASPFFWAAYKINGDTRPLTNKNNILYIILLSAGGLLIAVLLLWRIKKRK